MAQNDADLDLIAIPVYRLLRQDVWFQVDPLVDTVEGNFVNGVRCEVAEAIALPEGGQVIWRISGVPQCAEDAHELEVARQKQNHQVKIGRWTIDPVKLRCVPKRIVSRTLVNVLPLPLINLKRVDSKTTAPGSSLASSSRTTRTRPILAEMEVPLPENAHLIDAPEIVVKPTASDVPTETEPECIRLMDSELVEIKQEAPELPETQPAAVNIPEPKPQISSRSRAEPGEGADSGVRVRKQPTRKVKEMPEKRVLRNRSRASANPGAVEGAGSKRAAREEIVQSEKKLKKDPTCVPAAGSARPIDPECVELQGKASIYVEGTDVYDVMLNQTNVEWNNNKYYLMQLLKANDRDEFFVWFRCGRVGKKGWESLVRCRDDVESAKQILKAKFYDKTLNHFEERHNFEKVKGKYDLVQVIADETDSQTIENELSKLKAVKEEEHVCKLEPALKELIELICNVTKMEAVLKELKFDSRRSPLGKLTRMQIAAGYAALLTIEECISNGVRGSKLTQACNDFYTRIPHDFGMRIPPVISSHEEVREKVELLQALTDVQFAVELLRRKIATDLVHPVDRHYLSLKTGLRSVSGNELALITDFMRMTHAPTHSEYLMEIKSAFAVDKPEEVERFNSKLSNRMLLWHGSRLSNWASIISQGLRVAPPEAPVTGYMFGKGVYFADSSSKSANYCFPSYAQDEGILLLSEVALGQMNELYEANYDAGKLPKGKHSVKGMGRMVPCEETYKVEPSPHDKQPVTIPCGKLKDISRRDRVDQAVGPAFKLNYNEYIVYNVNQIKMRYILRIKFVFS